MVKHRGDGENGTAQHGPARADQQAEEDDGFQREVGREEVWNKGAEPDTEGKRNKEEREQAEGLAGASLFSEEEAAKGGDARQHTGHRSHDTQLDEQGDEDEPVGHLTNVSCIGGSTETLLSTKGLNSSATCAEAIESAPQAG